MKKITKNIFLSLALLACGVSPLATSLSFGVNRDIVANTNESQIVDSDDVLEDDPVSDDDTGDSGESEPITYTYKSYLDYFIDNMDCTGVYDTDNNLTDVTISAEKKAEILSYDFTGSGTVDDPYQINTTNGFWYMSNFVDLTNKYLSFGCDVILNDEKFDENGNASGGDGVVYSWQSIKKADRSNIDGHNHIIYGLYSVDSASRALFYSKVKSIFNLSISNVYLESTKYSSMGMVISPTTDLVADNCHNLGGTIKANENASGLFNYGSISNCTNKANLYVKNSGAGISIMPSSAYMCVNYGNIYIENDGTNSGSPRYVGGISATVCAPTFSINYGNISVTSSITKATSVGGIAGYTSGEVLNCDNYGKIVANSSQWGGILGYAYISSSITNCNNYANLVYANGILGYGHTVFMKNCNNYGNVKWGSGLIGQLNQSNKQEGFIKNCNVYGDIEVDESRKNCGIFVAGSIYASYFEISNCRFKGKVYGGSSAYFGLSGNFVGGRPFNRRLIFRDIKVNAEVETASAFILGGGTYNSSGNLSIEMINCDLEYSGSAVIRFASGEFGNDKVLLRNCNIKVSSTNEKQVFYLMYSAKENLVMNNVIIIDNSEASTKDYTNATLMSSGESQANLNGVLIKYISSYGTFKHYYGTNFRNFYISYKYNTIGLSDMDGVSVGQGSITTTWLDDNGWVKKG